MQPGSGDSLQFMKSGILEIPDVIAVTKSDIEQLSNNTFSDIISSKNFLKNDFDWEVEVLLVSSLKNFGFDKLVKIFLKRWQWLNKEGLINDKRYNQDLEWIRKCILNEYGNMGLKLIKDDMKYVSPPFKFLDNLRNRLILKIKS